jgi:tRNA(fMet)-specific endonuclease VapC
MCILPIARAKRQAVPPISPARHRACRIIQQIDMQVGAVARTLPNCVVVSKDADLAAIPGITVENWA